MFGWGKPPEKKAASLRRLQGLCSGRGIVNEIDEAFDEAASLKRLSASASAPESVLVPQDSSGFPDSFNAFFKTDDRTSRSGTIHLSGATTATTSGMQDSEAPGVSAVPLLCAAPPGVVQLYSGLRSSIVLRFHRFTLCDCTPVSLSSIVFRFHPFTLTEGVARGGSPSPFTGRSPRG